MTDYKQLCAGLLEWAERTSSHYYKQADVIIRARAALTEPEPEPEGPSLKEQAMKALDEAVYMADDVPPEGISTDQADTIRRALESLPD